MNIDKDSFTFRQAVATAFRKLWLRFGLLLIAVVLLHLFFGGALKTTVAISVVIVSVFILAMLQYGERIMNPPAQQPGGSTMGVADTTEGWQPIDLLTEEPSWHNPIVIFVPTIGLAIARSRHGQGGIGSATHFRKLKSPAVGV